MDLLGKHLFDWEEEEIFFELLDSISPTSGSTAPSGPRAIIPRNQLQGHS
jgi:hypothetical protein